jgi:predicted aspartyl protease
MIQGLVTDDGVPTIQVPVAGRYWQATLDTGFNGDLELPESLRPALNAVPRGRLHFILAGGQTIEEETYTVDFPFDGQTVEAQATFVKGHEILIGTHLIRRYRLAIDFVAQTVLLDRVA